MRYMYLVYGIAPYSANGNTVVSNYSGSIFVKETDPAHDGIPSVGDILSFAGTKSNPNGHTAIVTAVSVTSGTGTLTTAEQNASANGVGSVAVNGGVVGSGVSGWLHNPTSGGGGGGGTFGPSLAISPATGKATAVAVGPNNSLYAYWQLSANGQWAGPLGIGGGTGGIDYSRPAIAINPKTGLATAVAVGPSHSLYAYWETSVNGQWAGPLGIDGGKAGIAYSAPSLAFNPKTGLATVVAEGPSNSLYAYWQTSVNGQWAGPLGIDGGKAGIAY